MLKKLIIAAIGFGAGTAVGYFIAKKKFDKALDEKVKSLERTYKAMRELDEKKANEEKEAAIEKAKIETKQQVREEDAAVDVIRLADAEQRELNEFWECRADDPDFNDDWKEYFESIEDYLVSTSAMAPPYNITEEMFSDPSNHYNKVHVVLDLASDYPTARNVDADEGLENYNMSLGVDEYDTLNDKRKIGGYWYIRNDYEDTDYCVEVLTMADLVH